MTTGQNYVGGDSHATATEQTAQNEAQLTPAPDQRQDNALKILYFGDPATTEGKHTVTIHSAFGSMLRNPQEINRLRQDVRTWFTTYIPRWEESYSESDLEESINHYELLDHFLSALINEGINNLIEKGGQKDE
jgi:hypothetical protein